MEVFVRVWRHMLVMVGGGGVLATPLQCPSTTLVGATWYCGCAAAGGCLGMEGGAVEGFGCGGVAVLVGLTGE